MSASLSVVKLGGSLLENLPLRSNALEAIATSGRQGEKLVVVHGGGLKVDAWLSRFNIQKTTHQGLRITDGPTLEVVVSVLAGLVNKSLVADFCRLGVAAAGLSGADGETLETEFHPNVDGIVLGYVGQIRAVRPTLIQTAFHCGMLPVIAPIGVTSDGTLLNINADRAASALAVALKARRLLFLTDVEGLFDGNGFVMPKLNLLEARGLLQSDFVNGGMRPKLGACLEALQGGVPEVVIAGPSRHSTVFSTGQGGTVLVTA